MKEKTTVADICIHPWDYAVEPFKIAGPLYYVGNRDVSSHLIDTGEGLILLDTAFPQTVYLLLESIRRLGFDPADIHTIFHTHAHYDHLGGTKAIVELTGAKTAMGEDDAPILTEYPERSWAPEYGVEFHEAFALDIPLRDGAIFEWGDVEVECAHTRGHTPGTMSFFLRFRVGKETLTAGMYGGPGLNPLTDEYLRRYGLSDEGRLQYIRSVKKLQEREAQIVLGAHPRTNDTLAKRERMNGKENPFIDTTAWAEFLSRRLAHAEKTFGGSR